MVRKLILTSFFPESIVEIVIQRGITKNIYTRRETMLQNIGIPGLILIVMLALIIFGPKKLPELGRAVGTTIREFKQTTKGIMDDSHDSEKEK